MSILGQLGLVAKAYKAKIIILGQATSGLLFLYTNINSSSSKLISFVTVLANYDLAINLVIIALYIL